MCAEGKLYARLTESPEISSYLQNKEDYKLFSLAWNFTTIMSPVTANM